MKRIYIFKLLFVLLLPLVFTNIALSKEITLKWLQSKPRSIERDFYIWRYLNNSLTSKEANIVLGLSKRVNSKIFKRYLQASKKAKNLDVEEIVRCYYMKAQELATQGGDCFYIGITISKASQLSAKSMHEYMSIMRAKNYEYEYEVLRVLSSKDAFFTLKLKGSDAFLEIFRKVKQKFRHTYFNKPISSYHLEELKQSEGFSSFVNLIVTDFAMSEVSKSLLKIKTTHLNYDSAFLIAINAIRYDSLKLALQSLDVAYSKTNSSYKRDKVNFWRYMLTTQDKYLLSLVNSKHTNIYSIWAREKNKTQKTNIKYFTNLANATGVNSNFDIKDPFMWRSVRIKSKQIAQTTLKAYQNIFTHKRDQGYNAYLLNAYNGYKNSYFITPFSEILNQLPNKRRALINAIAKQESAFIASSLSSSYAMGIMQIMPFLSKHLAKELKEDYNIDDMFNDRTNLRYANKHLDFLTYRLKHILFLAYAYNGGIGYTKRLLQKKYLFKKAYKNYEPFLSMELVNYPETREYGKAVMANYLIYLNRFNSLENELIIKTNKAIKAKYPNVSSDKIGKLHKKITLKELLDTIYNPYL
jgi:soluble lytic murein transglycosylase